MVRKTILALAIGLLPCRYYDIAEIETENMAMKKMASRMASNVGWSQSGQLITFAAGAGVSMQKEFPVPGNYTVQFGLGPPPGFPAAVVNTIRRPVAEVRWSVEGNEILRQITVQDGTSISGQAEAVSVRLFDDLVPPMFGVPGGSYVGSIQVTRGLRASPGLQAPVFYPRQFQLLSTFPTLNQSSGALVVGANDAAFVQIPEGATQLMVNCMSNQVPPVPLTQADVRVDIQDASAVPFGLRLASYFPQPSIWVALPSQASSVALRHFATPATDVEYSVLFGIDG